MSTAKPSLNELFAASGLTQEDLDETVHDAASLTATEINNGGPERQLAFLAFTLGETATRALLTEGD